MTRISTFSQSQALLQGLLNNQERIFEAQRQVTTGKISDEFKGIASQTSTLVGARSLKARTDSYVKTAREVELHLDSYDVQISAIMDSARAFKQRMLETLGQEQAVGFSEGVNDVFNQVKNALNFNIGGSYIFSGSRSDQPPLSIDELSELEALSDVSDAFQNDSVKAQAALSDSFEVTFGQLADEVGGALFASFKRIAEFNAGADGPFEGELSDAQRGFLENELQELESAIQAAQKTQIMNGLNGNKVEDIKNIQKDQSDYLEIFVADIEDVDIAEAITRLNNDQTALQASYQVVGSISRLSLVNFL